MHAITLVGRLLSPPEVRYFPSGTIVTTLFVLARQKWVDPYGHAHTSWARFRVLIFGKHAESLANHLKKGDSVFVQGKLTAEAGNDARGEKVFQVVADLVLPLQERAESGAPIAPSLEPAIA